MAELEVHVLAIVWHAHKQSSIWVPNILLSFHKTLHMYTWIRKTHTHTHTLFNSLTGDNQGTSDITQYHTYTCIQCAMHTLYHAYTVPLIAYLHIPPQFFWQNVVLAVYGASPDELYWRAHDIGPTALLCCQVIKHPLTPTTIREISVCV